MPFLDLVLVQEWESGAKRRLFDELLFSFKPFAELAAERINGGDNDEQN